VRVGAEDAMDMPVTAFTEQIQVIIGYLGTKVVGVVTAMRLPGAIDPGQAIVTRQRFPGASPLEQIRCTKTLKLWPIFSQAYFTALGPENANGLLLFARVESQYLKGIVMAGIQDAL